MLDLDDEVHHDLAYVRGPKVLGLLNLLPKEWAQKDITVSNLSCVQSSIPASSCFFVLFVCLFHGIPFGERDILTLEKAMCSGLFEGWGGGECMGEAMGHVAREEGKA